MFVYVCIKDTIDTLIYIPTFVGQICILSMSIYKPLEALHQGFQICPFLHANIRESRKVFLCMTISGFPKKNCSLYPIKYLARMPLSICLYMHLKRCTSVYAYVRVSIYVTINMHILWFSKRHVSKSIYAFLKNAPLFKPLSGSLRTFLCICLYMSVQRYPYLHDHI